MINTSIRESTIRKHSSWFAITAESNILLPIGTLICVLSGLSETLYGQTAHKDAPLDLPKDVRIELEKQAAAMATIHIEYTVARSGDVGEIYGGPETDVVYFNFGRFYQRIDFPRRNLEGKVQHWIHENAFDGTVFYFGDPTYPVSGVAPRYTKYSSTDATDPNRRMRLFEFLYLDYAGFYVPGNVADLEEPDIEALVLHAVERGNLTRIDKVGDLISVTVEIDDPILMAAKQTSLQRERKQLEGGRNSSEFVAGEIEILKKKQAMIPKRTVAFTLDSKLGYSVVERDEWTAAGQKIVEIRSEKWKYYERIGVWLPGRCVAAYRTNPLNLTQFSDQPSLILTADLKLVEFGSQHKVQFKLDYKEPGTIIADRTTPEARQRPNHQLEYTVAADGSVLRGIALDVYRNTHRGHWYLFWLCLNAGILGTIVAVLLIRYKKKKSAKIG